MDTQTRHTSTASQSESEMGKLAFKERIAYGFGGMGNALVYAVITGFLMFFYTDTLHINGAVVGTIFLIAKFMDAISDLVMGYIVDRTHSKYGQARPWLLWLSLPYALSGILIFLLQKSWPQIVQYVYIFITYTLCGTFMYTGVCTPYNSMNALITRNQYERGLLGSTNVIGNLVAQILVNTFMLKLVAVFGNTQSAWILSTTVIAIVGWIAHIICFHFTKERVHQSAEEQVDFGKSINALLHNKYWILITLSATLLFLMNSLQLTSAVYFAKGIIHNPNAVAGLTNSMNIGQIVMILFSFIYLKRLGKGTSFKWGYVIVTISYVLQIFLHTYWWLMVLGVVRGLGMGMAGACLAGIISDTVEYGEWKTGIRSVGMANAANTFSQKIGMGVGTAIVGWLTAASGYNASTIVQSASATFALNMLFTYIPLICAFLIVLLMSRYDLDKFYDTIIKDLRQ